MLSFERDSVYIASQLKFVRKMFRLTQENVAEMANLSTRTIEKIESGRHKPDQLTLQTLARGLGLDVTIFIKPSEEEKARQAKDVRRALKKTVIVQTKAIHTSQDFLQTYQEWHAVRFDMSAAAEDEAQDAAATIFDLLADLDGVWALMPSSERLGMAREFVSLCKDLEKLGYVCHLGEFLQRLTEKDRPDLVFRVGIARIGPRNREADDRFAIVALDGKWETVD